VCGCVARRSFKLPKYPGRPLASPTAEALDVLRRRAHGLLLRAHQDAASKELVNAEFEDWGHETSVLKKLHSLQQFSAVRACQPDSQSHGCESATPPDAAVARVMQPVVANNAEIASWHWYLRAQWRDMVLGVHDSLVVPHTSLWEMSLRELACLPYYYMPCLFRSRFAQHWRPTIDSNAPILSANTAHELLHQSGMQNMAGMLALPQPSSKASPQRQLLPPPSPPP
jgi:hypothetical protein